jgi:hypothetical protein
MLKDNSMHMMVTTVATTITAMEYQQKQKGLVLIMLSSFRWLLAGYLARCILVQVTDVLLNYWNMSYKGNNNI